MCEYEKTKGFEQWKQVLLEWANCLSISKNVECLNDLKNGDFLCSLLQHLTKTSTDLDTVLLNISDLFKIHYHNFIFPKHRHHISECSDDDLITMCSLLVHYACIIDRQEIMTKAMCINLSECTQLMVKYFLENITSEISQDELLTVITETVDKFDVDYAKSPVKQYWPQGGDTLLITNSPLQDILSTPKASKSVEKDREIKRLQHELQMEKFEKDDLVMELREHKEKIKKIGKEVAEKTQLIARLQKEIVALENKTPPHKPKDMQEVERMLRAQLLDSQHHVDLLQAEQDAVRAEYDEISTKLRKTEEKACLWQKQVITLEEKQEHLSNKCKQQEAELSSLRINYNELSAFVKELRLGDKTDQTMELEESMTKSSKNNTVCDEELAQTVIEVQLQEEREENLALKDALLSVKEKSASLEKELKQVKKNLEEVNGNYVSLQESRQSLEAKVLELHKNGKSLEEINLKLCEEITELKEDNGLLRQESLIMQESFEKVKLTLFQRDENVAELQDINEVLKKENLELTHQISERTEQFVTLQRESTALQELHQRTIEDYNTQKLEVEAVRTMYEKLDFSIERNLNQLENIISNPEANMRLEPTDKFYDLFIKLENKTKSSNTMNKNMINKLICQIETNNNRCQELEQMAANFEKKVECLEHTIEDLNQNIRDLELLNADLGKRVKMLDKIEKENEVLKERCRNGKSDVIKKNSENEILKKLTNTLENDLKMTRNELDLVRDRNDDNERMIQIKEMEFSDTQKLLKERQLHLTEYKTENKRQLEQIVSLYEIQKNYQAEIETLEINLKEVHDALNTKVRELADLSKYKELLEEEHVRKNNDLCEKLNLLKLTSRNLQAERDQAILTISVIATELNKQSARYQHLKEERDQVYHECENLHKKMLFLSESMSEKEKLCEDKDEVISHSSKELVALKLELEAKYTELQALKEKAASLHIDKENSQILLEKLETENAQLISKINNLNDEIKMMDKLKVEFLAKCEYLEWELSQANKQVLLKESELCQALKTLEEYKSKSQNKISCLKTQLEESNDFLKMANEQYLSVTDAHSKKIEEENRRILSVNVEIETYKMRELSSLQEIAALKDELNYTIDKYSEAIESEKEMRMESESQVTTLTESLHSMVEKYNTLDTTHTQLKEDFISLKDVLNDLKTAKQLLEIRLVDQKTQYENDFLTAAEEYKTEIEAITQEQTKLESEVERLSIEASNKCQMEIEVEKLRLVNQEKKGLLEKIESMIEDKHKFEAEFKQLEIQNKQLLKKNVSALNEIEEECTKKIQHMKEELQLNEEVVTELKTMVSELQNHILEKEKVYEKEELQYNKQITQLKMEVIDLEKNLVILEEERQSLKQTLEQKKDEEYLKLQCAFDILGAGKQKLENSIQEYQNNFDVLVNEKKEMDKQFKEETTHMSNKIEAFKQQLQMKEAELLEKENKMHVIMEELQSVKQIVEALNFEKENLATETRTLEMQLSVIREENDAKMSEHLIAFNVLKEKHEQICAEIEEVRQECKKRSTELENVLYEKAEVENKLRASEEKFLELKNKYDSQSSMLLTKETTITSLQKEMEAQLVEMEDLFSKKQHAEIKLNNATEALQNLQKEHQNLQTKNSYLTQETEQLLLKAHQDSIKEKNVLIENAHQQLASEAKLHEEVHLLLKQERRNREFFEIQLLETKKSLHESEVERQKLKSNVKQLVMLIEEKVSEDLNDHDIDQMIATTEGKIVDIFGRIRKLNETVRTLEKENIETTRTLGELKKCNELLHNEKSKLVEQYELLQSEKVCLLQDKDKDGKYMENLKTQFEILKLKYEEEIQGSSNKLIVELENKLDDSKQKNKKIYETYQQFLDYSKVFKKNAEKVICERNSLETIIMAIKENHISLQISTAFLTEEHRLHYEQKQALEIIVEDINKQFSRLSKMSFNVILNTSRIIEKAVVAILTEQLENWQVLFEELNIEEVLAKLEDLKDNSINTLEQMKAFDKSITLLLEKNNFKARTLKENNLPTILVREKEDEWKKKYINIKQRLVLAENARNNFEKKIKQLREELKHAAGTQSSKFNEPQTQIIVEYERLAVDFKRLQKELEACKLNENCKNLAQTKAELENVRTAYANTKADYSKLEAENSRLLKIIDEQNAQISDMRFIKEAYEKLFEENNKLANEIDTLKYKRNRDREEYMRMLKKEKEDPDMSRKIQDVRAECELKLEKMKEKMIQLYKEEVDRQIVKAVSEKDQNLVLLGKVDKLKSELNKASAKIHSLEAEKQLIMQQLNQFRSAERHSITSQSLMLPPPARGSVHSVNGTEHVFDERRSSTLPRTFASGMDIVEEVRICRRTSISSARTANIEMEDEDEMFNNKYLVDLKEGRRHSPSRESTSSRLSELAYRNSLCPPHLKSSYPAETQFLNPRRFKDDDLKAGQVDLDDSMSTRLLPYEKPKKKDIGTTTYRKPGPPTPSKNGGRTSLQGNEVQIVRDSPRKTATPSRLKALFSRSKDSSEVGRINRRFWYKCFCYSNKKIICILPRAQCRLCKRLVSTTGFCCYERYLLECLWFVAKNTLYVISVYFASAFIGSLK